MSNVFSVVSKPPLLETQALVRTLNGARQELVQRGDSNLNSGASGATGTSLLSTRETPSLFTHSVSDVMRSLRNFTV